MMMIDGDLSRISSLLKCVNILKVWLQTWLLLVFSMHWTKFHV